MIFGICIDPQIFASEVNLYISYVIIISAGMFKYLTLQAFADIISKFDSILEGVKCVVTEAN